MTIKYDSLPVPPVAAHLLKIPELVWQNRALGVLEVIGAILVLAKIGLRQRALSLLANLLDPVADVLGELLQALFLLQARISSLVIGESMLLS